MASYKFSNQQKFSQRMALTPQMRHSIMLLGLSTKDLNEYIDSALEANPFLKKVYDEEKAAKYSGNLASWNNDDSYEPADGKNGWAADPRAALLSQLRMSDINSDSLEIAEYLISEIDDSGYIKVEPEEIALELSAPLEDVEDCIKAIQNLDPPGIGARDVRECLQLQLRRMNKEDSLEYTIVSDFINELASEDGAKISKALGMDKEKIKTAINNIKRLNPRPASTLLSKGSEPVIPDLIAKVKNKTIQLDLNKKWLPRLSFYNPYEHEASYAKDPEVKKFTKDNIDSAKHLIDGLKRREDTICKVASYILNFHKDQIVADTDKIKSLTIRDISTALNLHSSTINRTVANKFIQIENKVMPLRNFLSHGMKKENGEITSKIAIKKRIEELVRSEDKSRPLSDKAIHEKLAEEGVIIQRRTVAKYRNSLRILPTYLRKKIS